MSARIREGDRAPDFTAEDQRGNAISLSQYRGSLVVLYFYPKDDTPGCTTEARCFRDLYEEFTGAGAVVIGVSNDSVESHRSFAERHELPFVLISDSEGEIRKAFGVPRSLGILPGRVTYIIDADGVVRDIFISQLRARWHVERALETVRRLQ